MIPDVFDVTATWGDVVMGIRHRALPIEGVQFHPESILTMENNHGLRLLGKSAGWRGRGIYESALNSRTVNRFS